MLEDELGEEQLAKQSMSYTALDELKSFASDNGTTSRFPPWITASGGAKTQRSAAEIGIDRQMD